MVQLQTEGTWKLFLTHSFKTSFILNIVNLQSAVQWVRVSTNLYDTRSLPLGILKKLRFQTFLKRIFFIKYGEV